MPQKKRHYRGHEIYRDQGSPRRCSKSNAEDYVHCTGESLVEKLAAHNRVLQASSCNIDH